jgi:hypothetical protein
MLRSLEIRTAFTLTLQVADEHSTNSVELASANRLQAIGTARLEFVSSMTDALISRVFKRPVLLDYRIKDYHNREFVDKEWRNLSQTLHLYLICTQIYVQICKTKFM